MMVENRAYVYIRAAFFTQNNSYNNILKFDNLMWNSCYYYYYRYSALGPVKAETRDQ
jgi:hypothetical protein